MCWNMLCRSENVYSRTSQFSKMNQTNIPVRTKRMLYYVKCFDLCSWKPVQRRKSDLLQLS